MQRRSGFTLIELMIVVTIISILAAIAYPSYQGQLRRSNRSAAEQLMLNIQSRQEQYFLDARNYTTTIGAGGLNITTQDTFTCAATCTNSFYTVRVDPAPAGQPPGYMVTATPVAGTNQVADGILYLNADTAGTYTPGAKTRSGSDPKW